MEIKTPWGAIEPIQATEHASLARITINPLATKPGEYHQYTVEELFQVSGGGFVKIDDFVYELGEEKSSTVVMQQEQYELMNLDSEAPWVFLSLLTPPFNPESPDVILV